MEGRKIVIESSEELNLIDGEILNALCDGLYYRILFYPASIRIS